MLITALTPNLDSHLFCEIEDEHRKAQTCLVILFAAVVSADGSQAQIIPVSFHASSGNLVLGGKRLFRCED